MSDYARRCEHPGDQQRQVNSDDFKGFAASASARILARSGDKRINQSVTLGDF